MTDPTKLIGKRVVIQNPHIASARWTGKAIAYSDFPTLTIEHDDGTRTSLPAAWATEDTPADPLQAVVDAWNVEGRDPVEHHRAQADLRLRWPTLARAVEAAARTVHRET